MEQNYELIRDAIEATRKQRIGIRRRKVLLAALSAVILGLLAAVVVLPELGGPARLIGRAVILAIIAGAALAAAVLIWLGREGLEATALAIEKANPQLKNELINSIQLMNARGRPGPAGAFSPAFLDRSLEAAAQVAKTIDFQAAADRRQLKLPALVCGALLVILAASFWFASGRSRLAIAALFSDPWSGPGQTAELAKLPLTLGDFTISYRFPVYSGIGEQTVPNGAGDVAGLRGTAVTIQTSALERLRSAQLRTSRGGPYAMTVQNGHDLTAEIVLDKPGSYSIEAEDEDGGKRAEPRSHRILVDDDLPPTIVMLTPAADVETSAEGELPIEFAADDDFGIGEIDLVYSQNGEEKKIKVKSITEPGTHEYRGDFKWELAELKFPAGARIPFYLEVADNDEVSGPKVGRSETRVLEIFSARKRHRQIVDRQEQLLDMMIAHLASVLLAGSVRPDAAADEVKAAETKLLLELGPVVDFIGALHLDSREDEYADEIFTDALADMDRRYRFSLDNRKRLLDDNPTLSPTILTRLAALRDESRLDLENDVIFLDKLIKKQRLDDLLAEAEDLYDTQADLADLLAKYEKTGDPALLEQLEKAMAELERAWADLMARMAEMQKDMPEEFLNTDAFKGESSSDLASQMEKLRQALKDGDYKTALELANSFLGKMGKFMDNLESDAGDFRASLSKELMDKLGKVTQDLDDLIKRQKEVEDELRKVHDRALERAAKADPQQDPNALKQTMEDDVAKLLEEFRASLEQNRNDLYQLRPETADGSPRSVTREFEEKRMDLSAKLNDAGRSSYDLQRLAKDGGLEEAKELAKQIDDGLKGAGDEAGQFKQEQGAGGEKEWNDYQQSGGKSRESLKKLQDYLGEASRRLAGALDDADRARLAELEGMQQGLRSETEGLMQQYESLRGEAASLPGEVSEKLGEAMFHMYDAAGEMSLGDPERAMPRARQARASLEQASEALSQAQSKCMRSGMGGPLTGAGNKRDRDGQGGKDPEGEVKIPGAEDFKGPEALREELLKAMKENSPDAYKNLNKDYYERLVR